MDVKVPVLRTLYDQEQSDWSDSTGVDCSVDPYTGEEIGSMAKQAFADECDINLIMARYEKTGVIDHVNRRAPVFDDFTDVVDYQTALNVVSEAEGMFADLSARVRARFDNDPAKLLEFVQDPANVEEARSLGLLKPVEELPVAPPPPPVPEPPSPPPAAS